jgi:hypothetical protein
MLCGRQGRGTESVTIELGTHLQVTMTSLGWMTKRIVHSNVPEAKAGKRQNSNSEGGPALALGSMGLW